MSVRYTATWYDVMQARQHHTHQSSTVSYSVQPPPPSPVCVWCVSCCRACLRKDLFTAGRAGTANRSYSWDSAVGTLV